MRRAAAGDRAAFSSLVEAHWNRLVAFSRSIIGDGEAEDLVQEAFVIAYGKLGGLREPAAFPAWITRIVARLGYRRAAGSRRTVPIEAVAASPDPGWRATSEATHVERILAVLAPRQRAVMHLTVVEEMTDSEIGAILGIRAGSVRAHRRRARERLRAVLGER